MDKTQLTSKEKEDIKNFMSELGSRKNLNLKEYSKAMKDFIDLNIDKKWTKAKKKNWIKYLSETIKKEHEKLNNVSFS